MRNTKVCAGLILGALLTTPLSFAGSASSLEVVESVPQGTVLGVPGIRGAQEVWVEMIQAAQNSIDLEQFYITNQAGEALDPVLNALRAAAGRGVHIRLLVDAKFYQSYPDDVNSLAQSQGLEARTIDFSSYGGIQHAKYFVVDGTQSFVGSQNFDWRALDQIHEVGLRSTDGSIASDLEKIFAKDWTVGTSIQRPTTPAPQPTSGWVATLRKHNHPSPAPAPAPAPAPQPTTAAPVAGPAADQAVVVASPQAANPDGIAYSGDQVVALIDGAQSSIRVQVMEYTTSIFNGNGSWHLLDDALRRAAGRGVHVQLAVDASDLSKAKPALESLAQVANVEVRVVTIPQLPSGPIPYARLIHSKYLVADGARGWVGSENWSGSYFLKTRDVGIAFNSANVASQLAKIFDTLWQSPYTSAP